MAAISLRLLLPVPCAAPSSTFCRAVSHGSRHGDWNTIARSAPGPIDLRAVDDDAAEGRPVEAGDDRQHRGLAAAGVAEDRDELAGLDDAR